MSADNINNPAFAVDNDLNDDISSGFDTTAESETDNSTIDGAVASDDSTFGAKRQSLAVLQQLGLELGHSIVYDKAAATRGTFRHGDAEVKLTTNIYGLKTKAINVYTYHIDMEKWFETGRHFPVVDLGRRTSDYTTLQNRQLQQKLLAAFMVKYPNVFGQDYEIFCFDYANTLYSLIELDNFDISMSMDPEETYAAINRGYKTTLNVKKPKENVFNIRDLTKSKSLNLAEQPYHIIRFLELATSRYISLHPEEHIMYESTSNRKALEQTIFCSNLAKCVCRIAGNLKYFS
uniref:Uncharacterized protein n=1 Tax=Panagrolaimus davidi TaxID=227884 RepID=A0A914PEB1_9BILA